jgi:hypothetical protein
MSDNEIIRVPDLDSNDDHLLFDTTDADWLASRNELSPAGPNKLRISRNRFHGRSSDEDSSSALPLLASPSASSPSASTVLSPVSSTPLDAFSDRLIEAPVILHSMETLEILGFDRDTAQILMEKWDTMDPDVRKNTGDFFRMTQDWLDSRDHFDAASPLDDWDLALRKLGVNEQLRKAILKPGYDDIRLTQSALDWVKFGMTMRWEALEDGYEASRQRASGDYMTQYVFDEGLGDKINETCQSKLRVVKPKQAEGDIKKSAVV